MKVLAFTTSEKPSDEGLDLLLLQLQEHQIDYNLLDVVDVAHQATCELYDITSTPALVVCLDDGSPVQIWQNSLPQVDDVAHALGNNV